MNSFSQLLPVIGMVLVLFIAPIGAIFTLAVSAIYEKASGFMLNFCCFVIFLLYGAVGFALISILTIGDTRIWLPLFMAWLLPGSIPHCIILIKGRLSANPPKFWIGISGAATTLLTTTGIGLLCYSARFF